MASRTPTRRRKPTPSTESRLLHHLSGLPPTDFSIHPRDLHMKYYLRPKIHVGCTVATTKSWLPPPPRCGAPPRLPRLRLVTAEVDPTPPPHDNFLADPGSILATALERGGELSYWTLLEYSDKKKGAAAAAVSQPSDDVPSRKLRPNCVRLVGPDSPCPGITVSHSVVTDPGQSTYGGEVTVRYVCAVPDPFDAKGKPMEFAAVIRFGGKKLYGMSVQGAVASMDVIGSRLGITGVGPTRGVPSSRPSRFFKEYLVKMEREILLVFLIHYESVEVVDDVEVFRLDLERLDWVKVERLEGKTMFLKESMCEWVESAEFGCRDNCVFFTEGKENNKWRVYDFRTCCISSV